MLRCIHCLFVASLLHAYSARFGRHFPSPMGQHSSAPRSKRPEQKFPAGRSFLMGLADVELQLVMQGLGVSELLSLARCNQRLLHVVDSDFAWKYAPMLHVDSSAPLFQSALRAPRFGVLRRAAFSVRWVN